MVPENYHRIAPKGALNPLQSGPPGCQLASTDAAPFRDFWPLHILVARRHFIKVPGPHGGISGLLVFPLLIPCFSFSHFFRHLRLPFTLTLSNITTGASAPGLRLGHRLTTLPQLLRLAAEQSTNPPAMAAFARIGFLAIAVVFHLVYIYSIFDIYFVSPIVSGMRLYGVERPPSVKAPADRLVLFVGTANPRSALSSHSSTSFCVN